MRAWAAAAAVCAGCGFARPADVAPAGDASAQDGALEGAAFTGFQLRAADNPVLLVDATASIAGTMISLEVPFATPRTSMIATFTVDVGATVAIDGAPQMSGVTANDFTGPVAYAVTSAAGVTTTYRVGVEPAALPIIAFAPSVDVPVPGGAGRVTVADVDHDGRLDLVVQTSTDAQVFLNQAGPGQNLTFGQPVSVPFGGGQTEVLAADLDGDGLLDLVASTTANHFSIALQTTATGAPVPTFGAVATVPTNLPASALVVGDLNGDDLPDVAVIQTETSTSEIDVFLNTTVPGAGTVTFASAFAVPTAARPVALALADVDGDGRLDLVAACFNANRVSVLANRTPKGASEPSFLLHQDLSTISSPFFVAVGDLDFDGMPEIVASEVNLASATVLHNTTAAGAAPSFAAGVEVATDPEPRGAVIADLNGDGKPDVTVAGDAVATLLSTTFPTGPVSLQPKAEIGSFGQFVSVGDLDGDGRPDLVLPMASGKVTVLLTR